MTALPLLGVDPGLNDGALCLLDPTGRQVLSWCAWWTATASKRPVHRFESSEWPDQLEGVNALEWWCGAVGQDSSTRRPVRCAIELPLPTAGGMAINGHSAAWCAHGIALGVLRSRVEVVHTPTAQQWRSRQLRCGHWQKRSAEKEAIRMAELAFVWGAFPTRLPVKALGALCEAAWIARDLLTVPL